MRRRTGSPVGGAARIALLAALLSPLGLPMAVGAQAVLPETAVAVVEGEAVWQEPAAEWVDPNAAPAEQWVEPAAPAEEWVDPAAAPAEEWVDPAAAPAEEWVDPAAAPADDLTAAGIVVSEAAVAVDPNDDNTADGIAGPSWQAVPLDQLPSLAPMGPPASTGLMAPDPNWSPPSKVYVSETGQPLGGGFLDVWRDWGGSLSWGYPLTPEIEENGVTVQYFGFGRFEFHPNDPSGQWVQFSDLGSASRPYLVRRAPAASEAVVKAADEAMSWLPAGADAATDPAVRYVPETGHTLSGDMLAFWTQTGEAGYLGNPVSEAFERDGVTYQVFERGRVAQQPGEWPYVLPIGKLMAARWGVDTSPAPQGQLPTYDEALFVQPKAPVLAANGVTPDPNGARSVLISLSQQYLWAYQGDVIMWQGYVSTGRHPFETPPGTFSVLTKYKTQTMEGVLGGEYYNVPNVPDILYFTNQGHAIHGAYWHNNFGTPMSHGCVNLPLNVAEWMYDWAPMGMTVKIVP